MDFIKGMYNLEIFRNDTNGYTVGLLKVKEASENLSDFVKRSIHIVGSFHEIKLKSEYIMYGELIEHPKFGEQFKVNSYEMVMPSKKDDLVTFLSSDLFPIGEKTAIRIYEKLGENAIDRIISDKTILSEIPRLTEEKIDRIYEALKNYEFSNTIIMKLTGYGFNLKTALSIYAKCKMDTLNIMEKNIYSVLDDIEISFKELDIIAINMGYKKDDENRMKALIIYMIKEYTFNLGDTYILISELYPLVFKEVEISLETLEYILIKLNEEGKIIIEGDKYYIEKMYRNEKYIASRLCFLNDMKNKKIDADRFITDLEKENDIIYDKKQREAIENALSHNLTIITGGPGTGKTTIIKAIVRGLLELYKAKASDIALLAPTGRAAKRMSEAVLLASSTIHRYLKWDKETNEFSVNEFSPTNEKYIIIDEVSMIDTYVMASLLKGIRRDVKLILVGDYNQLPSVGEGQVLKDIIDSDYFNVIKLDSLYRQSEDSYIVSLAKEIREKELSENYMIKKNDYNFIRANSYEVKDAINQIITKAMSKGLDDNKIQVLVPMYKGEAGIDNLNAMLKDKFNPNGAKSLKVGDVIYKVGDKVLQLVNDIENNVFNGDMGYILDIKLKEHNVNKKTEILIDFDGNIVSYTYEHFYDFRHAYAISIHKAQGNEFDMVIIPIVPSFKRMLYNKLIYTGITRAKKTLILVGDINSFIYSVNNDYIDNRKTTLKDFFKNKYNVS